MNTDRSPLSLSILALASAVALAACSRPDVEHPVAPPPVAPAPCAIAPASSVASAPAVAPAASVAAVPAVAPTPVVAPATVLSPAPARAGAVARPATPVEGDALVIKRLVVARGVEKKDREPVDAGTTFRAADLGKLYAFVELDNAAKAPSELVVSFEPPSGHAIGNVKLDIGASPHWRTWAYTRAARETGAWTAVVKTSSGHVLARAPFEITS